jgi:hypothetical protein
MSLTRRHFLAALCGLPLLSGGIAFSQDRRFALVGTVISGNGPQPLKYLHHLEHLTNILKDGMFVI